MNKIIDGLYDAMAFARIQVLVNQEIDRLEANFLEHPGSAPRDSSAYLQGLLAAQGLFAKTHVVEAQQAARPTSED